MISHLPDDSSSTPPSKNPGYRVKNTRGCVFTAFFCQVAYYAGWRTWTGALYSLGLVLGAAWVWIKASHAMDLYEHIALLSAVGVLGALGIWWPRFRIVLLGICGLIGAAIGAYRHDLARADTVFILKYALASQSALLWMGTLFLVATLFYWIGLLSRALIPSRLARGFCWAAVLMGSTGLGVRWYESYLMGIDVGHIPISNLYEVFVLFCLMTAMLYLYFESSALSRVALSESLDIPPRASIIDQAIPKQTASHSSPVDPVTTEKLDKTLHTAQAKIYALGAFVLLIITAALGFLTWYAITRDAQLITPLVPALQSGWMKIHVPANFMGYGSFAFAAMLSLAYLLKRYGIASNRLPDFNVLDELIYQAIMVGFAFFTLATILGALWAAEAWGGYWSWDPKETWALIVWLNYAAWLHMRLIKGLRGTVSAWWAFIGLFITAFAFLGVNMFLSGLHSYGTL